MKTCVFIVLFVHISVADVFSQRSWKREIHPFSGIGSNSLQSFSGKNSLWHFGGVASTYLIIESRTDYRVHNYFSKNNELYNVYTIPAVYLGYVGPVVIGGSMYAYGLLKDKPKPAAAGCAVLQASLLAWTETSLLKVFTGRPNHDSIKYTPENDASRKFNFGFFENGIHYGWPSGHLGVSTAVLSSLASFYCDNKLIKTASWIAWGYMFLSVTAHEGNTMHWFSDVVTGSMMGVAIGTTVGKNFRKLYDNKTTGDETGFYYSPYYQNNAIGIKMGFNF